MDDTGALVTIPDDGNTATAIVSGRGRDPAVIGAELWSEWSQGEADYREAHARKVAAFQRALRVGQLLIEAKAQLDHGEWLPWLQEYFPASARTAERFMQMAEVLPALAATKSVSLSDLTMAEGRRLVAAPAEPMEAASTAEQAMGAAEDEAVPDEAELPEPELNLTQQDAKTLCSKVEVVLDAVRTLAFLWEELEDHELEWAVAGELLAFDDPEEQDGIRMMIARLARAVRKVPKEPYE